MVVAPSSSDMDAARVRDVSTVGADTVAVELESPSGFDPQPGQFVKLSAYVDGEHVSRFYTLSSPDATDTFEVTIAVDPDGTLGPWLASATGETVQIEGPYGRAYYEGEPRSLIVAGGPGVGPAVGIGERALADDNEVVIVYRATAPAHEERLSALADDGATVEITDGAIDEPVADHHRGDEQVFIYGFQEFVTDAMAALEAAGGDPDAAKVENFGAG